jgi:hypothetical protein
MRHRDITGRSVNWQKPAGPLAPLVVLAIGMPEQVALSSRSTVAPV